MAVCNCMLHFGFACITHFTAGIDPSAVLCRLLDQETVAYILTLGVTDQYRHLGIASQLIQKVVQHAQTQLSRAVYLHVIDYNEAALNLYNKNKFEELAALPNFYHIE